MSEPSQVLRNFTAALMGVDVIGNGACEICGRDGVMTWVAFTSAGRIELCGPCLREDLDSRLKESE